MNIQWDEKGLKGVAGKYEISTLPFEDGWKVIIWVGKTHVATLPPSESKEMAHQASEMFLVELTKATRRLMDRIGYDNPIDIDDGDE